MCKVFTTLCTPFLIAFLISRSWLCLSFVCSVHCLHEPNRAGVPNQGCSHPLGVRSSILGGARWSFRFFCCIFVRSCSVHHVLIVLHNQCLITACLMRGLHFSQKRCEGIFLGDHLCNNGEKTAEFACLKTTELDSKPGVAKCHQTSCRTGDDLFFFFFFFLENTAECGLTLTSKHQNMITRLRAITGYECLRGASATFSGVFQKKKGHHLSGVKFGVIFGYRLFFFFGDRT